MARLKNARSDFGDRYVDNTFGCSEWRSRSIEALELWKMRMSDSCLASISYHATSVQHDAYKGQDHSDGNKNLKRDVNCTRDYNCTECPTKRCGNCVTARRLLINSAQTFHHTSRWIYLSIAKARIWIFKIFISIIHGVYVIILVIWKHWRADASVGKEEMNIK